MNTKDRVRRLEAQSGKIELLDGIVFKVEPDGGSRCYREVAGKLEEVSEAELDRIEVELKRQAGKIDIEVTLPPGHKI